jgi:ATP-dependent Clp protease ATP-binding subunit ClpC
VFERFTSQARAAVVHAQDEARRLGHNYIGTEHLLLGLVYDEDGLAVNVLEAQGISCAAVRQHVEAAVPAGQDEVGTMHISFMPRARRALELSLREAVGLRHGHIGTEHILLGLTRQSEGPAHQVLSELGVRHDRVRELVIEFVGASQTPGAAES